MKTSFFFLALITVLFMSPVLAQKIDPAHPPKVSKTPKTTNKPGDFRPASTLKIQTRCKMVDGKDRPYPCEFSFDKLEVYAKDGSLIGEMTHEKPGLNLPLQKAKQGPDPGSAGAVMYTVKAYITRLHAPAFSAAEGYRLTACQTTNCSSKDILIPIFDGNPLSLFVTGLTIETFDLRWQYDSPSGKLIGPQALYLENKVTANKPILTDNMASRAEAMLIIAPKIVE